MIPLTHAQTVERGFKPEDRAQQCKLTTLETRRVHGDQIEVFKITHGIQGLDSGMFFNIRQTTGQDVVGRWLKKGVN